MSLAVAIVCKNNADTIGRTLASVRPIADHIVAVDSGSTDATLDLLAEARARVVRSAWLGHVRTKQLALEAAEATGAGWVLSLDSDESLDELAREWAARVASGQDADADVYWLNRKVFYRDRPLNHAWQPEWRVRLVRRGTARWTGLDPHDQLAPLDPRGPQEQLPGSIRHDSISTWADFLAKQAQHARTMATSLHAAGARPSRLRLVTSPAGAFLKQLVLKQAFRDGWPGWVAAASTGISTAMKHAILFEMANPPTSPLPPMSPAPSSRPPGPDSSPSGGDPGPNRG